MKPRPRRVGRTLPGLHDLAGKSALEIVRVIVLLIARHDVLILRRQELTERSVVRFTVPISNWISLGPRPVIRVGAVDEPREAAWRKILVRFGLGAVDFGAGLLQRRLAGGAAQQ